MAYRYSSKRVARKLTRNSQRNFIITLILIVVLFYVTLTWLLPSLITGIGFVKGAVKPTTKTAINSTENTALAPPILNIPYEATNTAQIDIKGYSASRSKVKLFLDDEEKQTIESDGNGEFTFKNIPLSLGTNNIYAKTDDDKNQESLPSKTIKILYDNEKPDLILNEPEDDKKIQGGDKKIKFSGKTDPETSIFINGTQIIVDKDGNFSSEQLLNDGDNNFTVKAEDKASNINEISRKVTYTP